MPEPCPTCGEPEGEEACSAKRAAFRREPWLPNGFELGRQWYSYDNGLTWQSFPCSTFEAERLKKTGTMTVVGIDQKTGTVTVKASNG